MNIDSTPNTESLSGFHSSTSNSQGMGLKEKGGHGWNKVIRADCRSSGPSRRQQTSCHAPSKANHRLERNYQRQPAGILDELEPEQGYQIFDERLEHALPTLHGPRRLFARQHRATQCKQEIAFFLCDLRADAVRLGLRRWLQMAQRLRGPTHTKHLVDHSQMIGQRRTGAARRGRRVNPIPHQRLADIANLVMAGEPDPEFPVLDRLQRLAETAGLQKHLPQHHDRGSSHKIIADQLFQHLSLIFWCQITIPFAIINAAKEYRIRVRPGTSATSRQLMLNLIDTPEIIRVQKRDPLAFGFAHAKVARGRRATVLLPDDPDTMAVFFQNLHRAVPRPVINRDDFDVRVGLGKYTCQRLFKVRLSVVYGNNNTDQIPFRILHSYSYADKAPLSRSHADIANHGLSRTRTDYLPRVQPPTIVELRRQHHLASRQQERHRRDNL